MQNHLNSYSITDKDAKAAGFKNAAEMTAFYANRERMRKRGGGAIPTQKKQPSAPPKKEDRSLLGRIFSPITKALGGD